MKSAEVGLSKNIGAKGEENLRLLATLYVYILRQVYTNIKQTETSSLVGDDTMLNA